MNSNLLISKLKEQIFEHQSLMYHSSKTRYNEFHDRYEITLRFHNLDGEFYYIKVFSKIKI